MGDDDLLEKLVLKMSDKLDDMKACHTELKSDILALSEGQAAIKAELDELKADDEGRDLLGMIRVVQKWPKITAGVSVVFLIGLTMTGSVILSTYKIDQIVEKAASPYMSGPPAPSTLLEPEHRIPTE